jgi:hypothetical protein
VQSTLKGKQPSPPRLDRDNEKTQDKQPSPPSLNKEKEKPQDKTDPFKLAPLKQPGGNTKLPSLGSVNPPAPASDFSSSGDSNAGEKMRLQEVDEKLRKMQEQEKQATTMNIKKSVSPDLIEDSIESDIDEEIPESDIANEEGYPAYLDSMGGSSMGVDASVNSVTLEGYDHVEPVSRAAH